MAVVVVTKVTTKTIRVKFEVNLSGNGRWRWHVQNLVSNSLALHERLHPVRRLLHLHSHHLALGKAKECEIEKHLVYFSFL